MKTCAACHEDWSKDKFSKKQWKLNQRRCKICVSDNREVQPLQNKTLDYNNAIRLLNSMSLNDCNTSISDEELFKQPPPEEVCLICFLRIPSMWKGHKYKSCCGKVICSGCVHANRLMMKGTTLCPFCRTPNYISSEERNERYYTRIAAGDAEAVFNYGTLYAKGKHGYPKDYTKALEFYAWAGKLGCAFGYHNIGSAYLHGNGVGKDMKKARHYWELAAINGHVVARFNLGCGEENAGNIDRALKHYMIAVQQGESTEALEAIKELFMDGHATKEDYTKALRLYQAYLDEIKSDQRDKAAAYSEEFKYHE